MAHAFPTVPRTARARSDARAARTRDSVGVGTLPARPCDHWAAIPLRPAMAHFGGDVPSERLRDALRCTACGHRGALLQLPSWGMSAGYGSLPLDRVPVALQRKIADDALRSIGVVRSK